MQVQAGVEDVNEGSGETQGTFDADGTRLRKRIIGNMGEKLKYACPKLEESIQSEKQMVPFTQAQACSCICQLFVDPWYRRKRKRSFVISLGVCIPVCAEGYLPGNQNQVQT